MTPFTLRPMVPVGILAALTLLPFTPRALAQSVDPASSFNQLLETTPLSNAALSDLRGG